MQCSKLLKKIKNVLNCIICESQSVFVPNRLITDNMLVSYKCVDYIMNKDQHAKGCMTLKLDMSKAYDHRVE